MTARPVEESELENALPASDNPEVGIHQGTAGTDRLIHLARIRV